MQKYQPPTRVDQGDVVEKTQGGIGGECWDGTPDCNECTRHCGIVGDL